MICSPAILFFSRFPLLLHNNTVAGNFAVQEEAHRGTATTTTLATLKKKKKKKKKTVRVYCQECAPTATCFLFLLLLRYKKVCH